MQLKKLKILLTANLFFICPSISMGQTNAHFLNKTFKEISSILDDPAHRISKEFSVPRKLRPGVGFWLQVYAKYSTYHTLIYDKDNPEYVYDVVDSTDLFNKGKTPVAIEVTNKKRVQAALNNVKQVLIKLSKNPKTSFPPHSLGFKIKQTVGAKTRAQWTVLSKNIRSQTGQRDKVYRGITNAERFFPAMEKIFKKHDIPEEITRLPLVESSFDLQAHSKVAAVGVWQFMRKSALEYLVIDPENKIDERLSPIKSTFAAAKMFKRNYKHLKDWGLSIIAYNHGAKNLLKLRNTYNKEKIADLILKKTNTPLGYASRNFYLEFLAMLHVEKYRDEIFNMNVNDFPPHVSLVRMKKPASIFELASKFNVPLYDLKIYNPDIFDPKRKLPAGIRVVLPISHADSLVYLQRQRQNRAAASVKTNQ